MILTKIEVKLTFSRNWREGKVKLKKSPKFKRVAASHFIIQFYYESKSWLSQAIEIL